MAGFQTWLSPFLAHLAGHPIDYRLHSLVYLRHSILIN